MSSTVHLMPGTIHLMSTGGPWEPSECGFGARASSDPANVTCPACLRSRRDALRRRIAAAERELLAVELALKKTV